MSNLGRLITNKKGDYLWLTSTNTSRFQGWFLRFRNNLVKVVDNLEVDGDKSTKEKFILAPYNPVFYYEIDRTQFVKIDLDIRRSYSNPKWGRNFEVEQENNKIFIYYEYSNSTADNVQSGSERGFSDSPCLPAGRRGSSPRLSALSKFCVVLKMPQKSFFVRLNNWVEKTYPYDKNRNSPPSELYIFRALKVKASSLSITAAPTKKRALANLHYAKKDSPVLIRKEKKVKGKNESDLLKGTNSDSPKNVLRHKVLDKAKEQAQNSLQSLLVTKNNENSREYGEGFQNKKDKTLEEGFRGARTPHPSVSMPPISLPRSQISDLRYRGGFTPNRASCREPCFAQVLRRSGSRSSVFLYAGLPWFSQHWSRDELISLKGLSTADSKATLSILRSNLDNIRPDGRLPNIREAPMAEEGAESADAVGWLFFRAGEFLAKDNTCFPHHSQFSVKEPLEVSLRGLLREHTNANGLAICGPGETWMDAVYKGDERAGARLEVQTLRLNMYNLAYEVLQKKRFKKLEQELKQKVRDSFWNGSYLYDGQGDATVRPNIFLAYYIYPQLLSEDKWRSCFDVALERLWCDWGEARNLTEENHGTLHNYSAGFCDQVPQSSAPLGGLATIAKKHPLFCSQHTGENPRSYHRGDSWFWINNLAAVSMLRLDSERYEDYIQKIANASVVDLFGGQIPGHASELSSASSFSPAGSPYQAWSAATLIELIEELQSQNFTE